MIPTPLTYTRTPGLGTPLQLEKKNFVSHWNFWGAPGRCRADRAFPGCPPQAKPQVAEPLSTAAEQIQDPSQLTGGVPGLWVPP